MRIARAEADLSDLHGCVLVPTMGALHEGHLSLVRQAGQMADRWALNTPGHARPPVVVSVFVNPRQFDVRADFERYPRDVASDAKMCARAGADAVFTPDESVVYPRGGEIVTPDVPDAAVDKGLEDAHRPGHFAGVCQVVRRLFELCRPAAAIFGEKDWQQLQVVRAMAAADRDPRIRSVIVAQGPTVREPDGLAMSSRNRFLSPEARSRATALSRALCEAAGRETVGEAEGAMRAVLDEAGARVDYATVRHAEALTPLPAGLHRSDLSVPARAIIAARFGQGASEVRLLDNAPWG